MATRWRPDTCGCELIFKDGSENTPTFVKRCNDHLQDTELTVWDENRQKNKTVSAALEAGVNEEDIHWVFEKKGAGPRHLMFTIPNGSPSLNVTASKTLHILRKS